VPKAFKGISDIEEKQAVIENEYFEEVVQEGKPKEE
jgi:hypothetical protein